jgi:ribosomal protein S27E
LRGLIGLGGVEGSVKTPRSGKKRYAIARCAGCGRLQLVQAAAKSHICSYCNKRMKLKSPASDVISFVSKPREALRTIMKLKSRHIL